MTLLLKARVQSLVDETLSLLSEIDRLVAQNKALAEENRTLKNRLACLELPPRDAPF